MVAGVALVLCSACHTCESPPPVVPAEIAPTAADYHSQPVATAIGAADTRVVTRGFQAEGEEWRGFLVDQAPEVLEVPLRSGRCYVATAAGSAALKELDLRIFDSDGGDVASGAQPGSTAALSFCPPQSGTYYLAARATVGSGLFAVRMYSGQAGLDTRVDDLFRPAEGAPVLERQ